VENVQLAEKDINTMLKILTNITEGKGELDDLDLLINLGETITEASLCGLGKNCS